MKTLTNTLLVIAISGLAMIHADAKTFGGFAPGKTFTLTVKQVKSSQTIGERTVKRDTPIPSGIPKFKVGEKVRFVIGRNGQLKSSEFSLPFVCATGNINTYSVLPSLNLLSPNGGMVTKNSKGQATGCALDFYKYRIPGTTINSLTINQVTYIFE